MVPERGTEYLGMEVEGRFLQQISIYTLSAMNPYLFKNTNYETPDVFNIHITFFTGKQALY